MPEEKSQEDAEQAKGDDNESTADDDVNLEDAVAEILDTKKEPAEDKGSAEDSAKTEDGVSKDDAEGEKKEEEDSSTEGKDETKPFDFGEFSKSEQGQQQLRGMFTEWLGEVRSKEAGEESAKEVEELIKSGDNAALGERFAKEYNQGKQRQAMTTEILKGFVTTHYRQAFQDSVFQDLSAEDRVELDPSKAKDDIDYMERVTQFRMRKAVEKALAEKGPELAKQAKEAAQKEGTAKRVKRAADGSPLPSGNSSKNEPEKAADLIAIGWGEVLEEAGYEQTE